MFEDLLGKEIEKPKKVVPYSNTPYSSGIVGVLGSRCYICGKAISFIGYHASRSDSTRSIGLPNGQKSWVCFPDCLREFLKREHEAYLEYKERKGKE